MSGNKRWMVLDKVYFNIELVFAPYIIILSAIIIILSLKQATLPIDKLVIGTSTVIIALLMLIEGITRKVLITVRIGLTPPVYLIVGLFLLFESVRRISTNFTSFTMQPLDFLLFLMIFSLGLHFLHIAGMLKFEDKAA